MTSTHTGNPVCCAAALASIELVVKEDLAGNARRMGEILHARLEGDCRSATRRSARWMAKAGGWRGVRQAGDARSPTAIWPGTSLSSCIEKGVLMFAPVGFGGGDGQDLPAAGDHMKRR